MGPNTIVTIDKNGNKTVYNFDSGESKPYWDKKKVYCETKKDDGTDKIRNQDLIDANPNNRPPATRPKGNTLNNILEILERLGIT